MKILLKILGNAGVIAGAVIGTLLGLALLAGVIVAIVVVIIKIKPQKKYKYTPPSHSKTPPRTTSSTTYKQNVNGSSNGSPSVNVVRPGGFKTSYQAPTNATPSAPPRNGPPPPKPGARPPPPSRPSPSVNKSYRPPPVAVAPHKPSPAAQRPQSEC